MQTNIVTKYQKILENSWHNDHDKFAQRLLLAYDLCKEHCLNDTLAPVHSVASLVAAPSLIAYVSWILQDARENNIARLYFVARDGQILYEIARILTEKSNLYDVELKYIYGSRQSWHRSQTHQTPHWIWADLPREINPSFIFDRLGIEESEQAALAMSHGIDLFRKLKSHYDIQDLKQIIESDPFHKCIERYHFVNKLKLENYFRQEGLFDNVNTAMVDLGWRGTLHETLASIQCGLNIKPSCGYFFGLTEFDTPYSCFRKAYCFDFNRHIDFDMILGKPDIYIVMEVFCIADHGTVTGFEEQNTKIVPICADHAWVDSAAEWGYSTFKASVLNMAKKITMSGVSREDLERHRSVISALLKAFWLTPTKAEAKKFSSFPWDAGQGAEVDMHPIAQPYRLVDIPRLLFRGPRKKRVFWVEGALTISPLWYRHLVSLSMAMNYRFAWGILKSIPSRARKYMAQI